MPYCDLQFLSAYIDGELLPADRDRLEAHLRNCAECAAELERLRGISSSLRDYQFDDLNSQELARVHHAIDEAADQPIFRLGLTLGAIAASILVVGSAWLMELPARPSIARTQDPPPASWELTMLTLTPGNLVQTNGDDIRLARADFTDWMLAGLSERK